MSPLSLALEDYLRLRRSLGYKLVRAGQLLADFVAYAEAAGAQHVRVDLALSWALLASNPDTCWRAQRLGILRGFARYLHAIDPAHVSLASVMGPAVCHDLGTTGSGQ